VEQEPRTENRLAQEASPYLRQHGQNPVDWFPWGPEALEKAKREDKPIFLSIGYSACHWCHVMERESFCDAEIAKALEAGFVAVKVDREERPDLDHLYQIVVQLMGRSGGWPLSVFLTPDQKPFFGGTYFPPEKRHGQPSFREVLTAVLEAYQQRRDDVAEQAEEVAQAITKVTAPAAKAPGEIPVDVLARAYLRLGKRFDDEHGGFGSRPKFPSVMAVEVLLRHAVLNRSPEAEARTRRVLEAMAIGGIHDHLGGGFHRYSTDEKWLVPHFEKMLYDNAQLLKLYADAGRSLRANGFVDVAKSAARWIMEAMESPRGGFFATEDADSEGEEGKFFVFSVEDFEAALSGDDEALVVARLFFGVTAQGNFEHSGQTVLSEVMDEGRIALHLEVAPSEVSARLARAKKSLFVYRELRTRPARDEKILACWNGLAISGLVELFGATGEARYLEAAQRAFARIETDLLVDGKKVSRFTNDQGHVAGPGYLDDHANVALAALDLHEATGEVRYLATARAIADEILVSFLDPTDGAFFFTPVYGETLLCRPKDPYDTATPSGAAQTATLLLRLGARFGDPYASAAIRQLGPLASMAEENPFGLGQTVLALDTLVRGTVDVVLVGTEAEIAPFRKTALGVMVPGRVLVSVNPADEASVAAAGPLAVGKTGQGVAYVCRGRTCSLPVSAPADLVALMLGKSS
jgi:uncharacterized protein